MCAKAILMKVIIKCYAIFYYAMPWACLLPVQLLMLNVEHLSIYIFKCFTHFSCFLLLASFINSSRSPIALFTRTIFPLVMFVISFRCGLPQ